MATHDYVIANGTGSAVRSDLNNALAAIVSNNSASSEPSTKYAFQFWADTNTGLLKQRNAANNAWIEIGTLASANLGLAKSASPTFTGEVFYDNATNAGKDILWDESDNSLELADDVKIAFGASSDFSIYHNGSHSRLEDSGTGKIQIGSDTGVEILTTNFATQIALFDTTQILLKEPVTLTGSSGSNVTALTSASSVTIDFSLSNHFSCTMGHNITFNNPSTESVGQSGSITLTQDGTGSRTAAWGSQFLWAGGTAPTLTTTAAAVDRIDYVVVAADKIHCVATLALA